MNCHEFVEFVMEYLDGNLREEEQRVFEGHIGACGPCLTYLDTYRETVRLGRSVCGPNDALPPDVPEELVQAILAARRASRRT